MTTEVITVLAALGTALFVAGLICAGAYVYRHAEERWPWKAIKDEWGGR